MKKMPPVCGLFLLTVLLLAGCGNTNSQKQSQKASPTHSSTEAVQTTPTSTPSSVLEQTDESEEVFQTGGKLRNKKAKIGSFQYTYSELEDGTVWIKRISFVKGKSIKVLKIPSKINGHDVAVIGHSYGTGIYDIYSFDKDKDGAEVNIFGVMLDETYVTECPEKLYKKTKNIEQIILPSTVKVLGLDTFEYLPEYLTLDIGDCVAMNTEYTFVNYEWSRIKVAKTNSKYKSISNMVLTKDGKSLVKAFGQCDKLTVPNGVQTIKENAFLSIKANKLIVPSSVNKIQAGRHNFHRNIMRNYIKNVSVSKDNAVYGKLENSIYKKSNKQLVLLCNEKQTIIIPEGIKIVRDFCCNGYSNYECNPLYIKRIEIPKSVTEYKYTVRCSKNATVVFKSKKCPKLGYPLFMNISSSKLTVYVPRGCTKKYKKGLKDNIGKKTTMIEQE